MTKQQSIRTTVADFIADRLADSDKTQREISEECGFETPNIITMFKIRLFRFILNNCKNTKTIGLLK